MKGQRKAWKERQGKVKSSGWQGKERGSGRARRQ